jgi:hypothetical protein
MLRKLHSAVVGRGINLALCVAIIFSFTPTTPSPSPARIQAAQLDTARAEIPMWDSTYKSGQAIYSPDTSEPAFGDRLAVWTSSHQQQASQVIELAPAIDEPSDPKTTNIQDKPNTLAPPSPITTNYTYNAANQMLTAGLTRFTYDANGISMVGAERAINYTYDFENRLNGAQTRDILPNGKWKSDSTLDFTYAGLGRRMQRGVMDKGVRKQILSRHEIQGAGKDLQYCCHYDGPDNSSNRTDPHNKLTFSGKPWDKETLLLQQRLVAERKANDVNKALAEKLMKIGYNKAGPSDNCFLYVRAQRGAMGKATPEWHSAAEIISWIKEFPGTDVPPTYIIGNWWRENHEKHPGVKAAEQMAKLYNEANPGQNLSANQFFKVGRGKPTVVGAIMLEIQEVSDRLNNNDVGHVSLVDRIDDTYCENGWHIREANYPYGHYHQTCVYASMMDPYFLY